MYLSKEEIRELHQKNELIIRPLLDPDQIGAVSIDLRLGTDFLLTSLGREVSIDM